MNEIHMHLIHITSIILILQVNTRMCKTKSSDHWEQLDIKTTKPDQADLIKHFLGEDISTDTATARARHTPSYLLLLYDALEGFEETKQGQTGSFPKIRSYRGLKGKGNKLEELITFPLSNVKWNDVSRMEIVIKLDMIKHTSTPASDQNITIIIHDGNNDTFSLDARPCNNHLIFDASVLKDTHQSRISIDKSLLIDGEKIRISRRNEPLLLTYEHLEQNPLLNKKRRSRRQTGHMQSLLHHDVTEGADVYSCRKYDWYIDISVFDNFSWWIQPRAYNAGFCSGNCRFPLTVEGTNSTSYSFMKNVWHLQTFYMNEIVPRASCVPVDYSPLKIIFMNNNLETDIMFVANMKVKSCGCR